MELKFFTSYFYQIRFFQPYMIPISTAAWDPKWFHMFAGPEVIFKDKRGIYNGIRCEYLHYQPKEDEVVTCGEACLMSPKDPTSCSFITAYRTQLQQYNFEVFYKECERIADKIFTFENITHEPYIILMVYETPANLCSERISLQEWVQSNGYSCEELKYPIKDNYT